jgi:uncharacterized protein involved in tolerance to divalent cations
VSVLKNLKLLHPYDVPQIISTEVTANDSYLRWVNSVN